MFEITAGTDGVIGQSKVGGDEDKVAGKAAEGELFTVKEGFEDDESGAKDGDE